MELPVSTSGGRPWRWPVNEGPKAVKKEKLLEHRKVEFWLRVPIIEKHQSIAQGVGASFFLLGFWGFVSRSATGTAIEFCYFCSSKVGRRQAGVTRCPIRRMRSF